MDRSISRYTDFTGRTYVWRWINLVSVDAVIVGLLWQVAFAVAFLNRWPSPAEATIVGLSIWMAYTADRLFDASKIDFQRSHTARHRFHAQHRRTLVFLWLTALGVNALLIIRFASESQLRWGMAAIALVTAYLIGIQLAKRCSRLRTKELLIGLIFAFGTSLIVWSNPEIKSVASVAGAMLLAGLLFAFNCVVISFWECGVDRAQGFASAAGSHPTIRRWLPIALFLHLVCTLSFGWFDGLPPLICTSLVGSDALMLGLVIRDDPPQALASLPADAAVGLPPAFCLLVEMLVQ